MKTLSWTDGQTISLDPKPANHPNLVTPADTFCRLVSRDSAYRLGWVEPLSSARSTAGLSAGSVAEIVRSYFDAFAGREPADIAAHVADDFVNEHTSALGAGCVGRAAYLDRLPGFLADMVDLRYVVEELVVDESVGEVATAAVFYTMTALWQGSAPIKIRGAQRLEVRDGLIVHRTDYWDSKVFLQQVEKFENDAAG